MNQRMRVLIGSSVLVMALASIAPAFAAGYLKIGDIKGESTDKGHKGEIDIESWSWGEAQPGLRVAADSAGATGEAAGRRQHKPLTIRKRVDKASPMLQEASNSGRVFPSITLTLPEGAAGQESYLKYKMENVMITSYQVNASGAGDPVPTESVSFAYEKIKTVDSKQPKPARLRGERQ